MTNIKKFKTRKEVTEFLKGEGIDTSGWTEEQWQSINTSQAEIHIQALAEAMWDVMNESTPKELKSGEWHIPFGDKIDSKKLLDAVCNNRSVFRSTENKETERGKIQVATARCARLSYMTFDGEIDYEKDIKLHDQLLSSKHMSPFEHCARVMSKEEYSQFLKTFPGNDDSFLLTSNGYDRTITAEEGWCNNFRGFIPYRYLIENNYDRES